MKDKLTILFLCTGNSCRSQMAEGWAKNLKSELLDVYSAGIKKHGLNPNAVKVMAEVGVDISNNKSNLIEELPHMEFDYVVTVCDKAKENCPLFPGKTTLIHKSFQDPPELAKSAKSEEEALNHYRKVRDEIKKFIENMP